MNPRAQSGAFAELLDEASRLRRKELALFRAELDALAATAARGVGLLVAAAALAMASVGLLCGALVAALVAAGWAAAPAALLAAAATGAGAAGAAWLGRGALRAVAAGPRRSLRALKRDAAMAREAFR